MFWALRKFKRFVRQSRARNYKAVRNADHGGNGGEKETYITRSNVLHVGNVVVDNLQEPTGLL